MRRITIEDDRGRKISFRKFLREHEKNLIENFISRNDLIKSKFFKPNQIDRLVANGKLHKIKYKNLVYFGRREVRNILRNSRSRSA